MNNSIKVLSTRLVIYTCTASMYRVKDRTEYTYSLELLLVYKYIFHERGASNNSVTRICFLQKLFVRICTFLP